MAVREYVGARYVPKFMGTYSATTAYEALSIVDDGLGTSYTSKVPVPVGTPLSDTDYWAVTGSMSGAIVHLQDQIDDINNKSIVGGIVTPEMFGAVADGVTDDSAAIEAASAAGTVYGGDNSYYVGNSITLVNSLIGGKYILDPTAAINLSANDAIVSGADFSNSAYPTDRGQWMLVIGHGNNVLVEGCKFHDGCNALYLDHCENVSVSNNSFVDLIQNAQGIGGNGYGVLTIECKNIHINDNNFIDVARHSIYLSHESGSSFNEYIFITNNLFKWTSAVVGNTTGFEVTMMIRPSRYVYIEGNAFENMFNVATLLRESITYNGVAAVKACANIYIKNNTGKFNFALRGDGVIYLDGNSTSLYESHSNIRIEDNDFEYTSCPLLRVGNMNGIYIKNNIFRPLTGGDYYPIIYNDTNADRVDELKNIYIIGNVIFGASTGKTAFIKYLNASALNPKNHGELFVIKNTLTNGAYVINEGVTGAHSYTNVKIIGNVLDLDPSLISSNHMADAAVDTIEADGNTISAIGGTFNGLLPLRCTATTIMKTDACVGGYGNTGDPTTCPLGTLYRDAGSNVLKINTPSGWFSLT